MKTTKTVVNEDTLEIEELIIETNSNIESDKWLENYKNKVSGALDCTPDEFFQKYKDYLTAEAAFKKLYEPFKEKLLKLYKEFPDMPNTTSIGGVKMTYVSPSVRTSIDSKKLKEEEPEIAKKFTKTTNVNATLRLGGLITDNINLKE